MDVTDVQMHLGKLNRPKNLLQANFFYKNLYLPFFLILERQWNMWIPGFGTDELRPYKRAPITEAHRQRMALIRKQMKKF